MPISRVGSHSPELSIDEPPTTARAETHSTPSAPPTSPWKNAGTSEFLGREQFSPIPSPSSEHSQLSPLPEPHRSSLPNPHALPGADQAFMDGNPLSVSHMGVSSQDIVEAHKRSTTESMMRSAGVAARGRRGGNAPISDGKLVPAQAHPGITSHEAARIKAERRRDQEWAASKSEGPGLTAARKRAEDQRFGMSRAEAKRRFAPDDGARTRVKEKPKSDTFGMSPEEAKRRFAEDK
jgi:hypothetical protein